MSADYAEPVIVNRAPAAALRDVIDSHALPRDFPELRPRGRKSKRNREHARLLERYERG